MKKIIFMDLDGVIADFALGYKEAFNRDAYQDDPFTVNQFCLQVPHFFRMLPIKPDGLELFNTLKNDYNIVFLTTPMEKMEFCKRDKIDWIIENLGDFDVLFSSNKAEYVIDNQSVLIDDMKYNLDPWASSGGTAIKFPQKIDRIISIIEETFNPDTKKIKKQLKDLIVEEEPTEGQKKSGNYLKGSLDFKGLSIKIENPKGSVRWGFGEDGKKWISRMNCHYGYVSGSEGADCDPVDVFIGPELNRSLAFVVNQNKADGMFDEIKVILGCGTLEEAEKLYLGNYQKGWESRIHSIVPTNTKKLREWLKQGAVFEPYK